MEGNKKNDPLTPSPGVILRQEQDDYYKQFSAEFEKKRSAMDAVSFILLF